MSEPCWFSTCVRLVVLIEGLGATRFMDSVILFSVFDLDDAFDRALRCGRLLEREYRNADGERVRWRLVEVLTIDQLEGQQLDGKEVYATSAEIPPGAQMPFDAEFRPEDSRPTQTGVQ